MCSARIFLCACMHCVEAEALACLTECWLQGYVYVCMCVWLEGWRTTVSVLNREDCWFSLSEWRPWNWSAHQVCRSDGHVFFKHVSFSLYLLMTHFSVMRDSVMFFTLFVCLSRWWRLTSSGASLGDFNNRQCRHMLADLDAVCSVFREQKKTVARWHQDCRTNAPKKFRCIRKLVQSLWQPLSPFRNELKEKFYCTVLHHVL